MPRLKMFKPSWTDYLESFTEEKLQNRLERYPYHIATYLNPPNMINGLKFETGRTGIINFYKNDFSIQREAIREIVEDTSNFNKRINLAVERAKRHFFVPKPNRILSYWNGVSWVSGLNGITPPWFSAFAAHILDLKPGKNVMIAGFGYGYASIVFSESMNNEGKIYAVDINKDFLDYGRKIVEEKLGYKNFKFKLDDALNGWDKNIKFDAIWPTLATTKIPLKWSDSLKQNGRLAVFRALNKDEFEYAFNHISWWDKKTFCTYDEYYKKWWENVCLSIYQKEENDLVEIERLYGLFNPPFLSEQYGISTLKEWQDELGTSEKELVSFLTKKIK